MKLVGCEDVEEVTQDAIAMAANILEHVERSGKQGVRACNIAYYALQHIKSGRRSVGNSAVDLLATGTQLHGKCQVMSFEEVAPANPEEDDGGFSLGDMISRDAEDPSTVGARAIDWERFLEMQDDCSKTIIVFTAEGRKLAEMARDCGFSYQSVQQTRKKLANEMREFFGENILAEIARVPGWKSSLAASRECHASRVSH